MADNKNQHYVPRCHLRPFTLDSAGLAINLYNIRGDLGSENAPAKGQCSKDYFYGQDDAVEDALQYFEGRYGGIVSNLVPGDSLGGADLDLLRRFLYLQYSRTETAAIRRGQALLGMDDLAHRGVEHLRKEDVDTSTLKMARAMLHTFGATYEYTTDLKVCFIENQAGSDFVTSDDPAIQTNRWHLQRLKRSTFGLVQAGAILLMPLTPRIYLMCYDGGTYTLPKKRGQWISIRSDEDVQALNEFQFLKCAANVYFRRWEELGPIRADFKAVEPHRPESWIKFWVGVQTSEDADGERYRRATEEELNSPGTKMISHSQTFPTPSRWISGIRYREGAKAYNTGSAAGFVRETYALEKGVGRRYRVRLPVAPESRDLAEPREAFLRASR